MNPFAGVGIPGNDLDAFRVERAENGFIVDMLVTEMEPEMNDIAGKYLGTLLGMAKAVMPGDEESKAAVPLPPMPRRPIKRPVRYICSTLDEVVKLMKQHWEA